MVTMKVEVELRGPMFQRPIERLERFLTSSIRTLVESGEQHLDEMLRPRPAGVYLSVSEAKPGQASTGHYRRSVYGRVSARQGFISDSGVVYGPWLEGISPRNTTTRFKGYSSFRQTGQWLEKQADQLIAGQVAKLIQELNG